MVADIGLCFHRDERPSTVPTRARAAEQSGFDEFWVIEDCFFTSGPSLAAAALAATENIGVGIGIMPAVARNPAVTAMEIATLADLGQGRFHAGIGHGVQVWMEQMSARVVSPVTMLDEVLAAVQGLLAGERLTVDGRYVALDGVALEVLPDQKPLVSAGVRGPRSLAVSGRRADGTILADFCSPNYVGWAREQIAVEVADEHRLTAFCSMAVGPDGDEMRTIMSHYLAEVCELAPLSLQMAPFWEELRERAADTGWLAAVQAMPREWWGDIAPVGTPDDAAAYITRMAEAGVDCVAIFPSPDDPIGDGMQFAEAVLPLIR